MAYRISTVYMGPLGETFISLEERLNEFKTLIQALSVSEDIGASNDLLLALASCDHEMFRLLHRSCYQISRIQGELYRLGQGREVTS